MATLKQFINNRYIFFWPFPRLLGPIHNQTDIYPTSILMRLTFDYFNKIEKSIIDPLMTRHKIKMNYSTIYYDLNRSDQIRTI